MFMDASQFIEQFDKNILPEPEKPAQIIVLNVQVPDSRSSKNAQHVLQVVRSLPTISQYFSDSGNIFSSPYMTGIDE